MATKSKTADAKVAVLKGQEGTSFSVIICYSSFVAQRFMYAAEDKVLEYIKRVKSISRSSLTHLTSINQMNRPFGAVDVSANLKGAVPKTARTRRRTRAQLKTLALRSSFL